MKEEKEVEEKKVLLSVDRNDPNITLAEILSKIRELQEQNPDMDIFWDGDEYAICGRKKKAVQSKLL